MKQILTAILRNQFNLFYRFGYTYIPKVCCFELLDDLRANTTRNSLINLFSKLTPFEYDEEYLILHCEIDSECSDDVYFFDIQNVVAIYPLSKQAKESIESRIDTRIRLENPVFEDVLHVVENKIISKEREKAIDALWHLCGFTDTTETYISKIGIDNLNKGLEHREKGIKANAITNGNYWEYLIAYDRYDYFPNTTLGYFYDAGLLFAYSKGFTSFEGSQLHTVLKQIENRKPSMQMTDIIKSLEQDGQAKGYLSQTTDGELKHYVVAPLFLLLRNEIRNADDVYTTTLFKKQDWLKEEFGDSFKYAIILLGAFFGFRKFYDAYYDSLELRFYKSHVKQDVSTKPEVPIERKNKNEEVEAASILKELLKECPGIKNKQNLYLEHIKKYGVSKALIDAIKEDKSLGNNGAPKNVIKYFEKQIKLQSSKITTAIPFSENETKNRNSLLCHDKDAYKLFEKADNISDEQKKILIKNLQYVQKQHIRTAENNDYVITHFINLCKTDKNKVPDFQLIESIVKTILYQYN